VRERLSKAARDSAVGKTRNCHRMFMKSRHYVILEFRYDNFAYRSGAPKAVKLTLLFHDDMFLRLVQNCTKVTKASKTN